jgi:hypothetical protein
MVDRPETQMVGQRMEMNAANAAAVILFVAAWICQLAAIFHRGENISFWDIARSRNEFWKRENYSAKGWRLHNTAAVLLGIAFVTWFTNLVLSKR